MDKDEFQRISQYAKTALDLLKRGKVPPFPKYFDLLFSYATGANPTLNARVNDLYERGIVPNTELVETLYQEFFRSTEIEERMSQASEKISASLDEVHSVIGSAQGTADNYSGLLESASSDLESAPNQTALKSLTGTLLSETRKMQETNSELENRLNDTKKDVSRLQEELDRTRRDSMLDPLTRLSNRQAFDLGIASAIEDTKKNNEPLSLLMMDIDHFKLFNDTYGHQTGDQVLQLVAKTIQKSIRSTDFVARYGGEEFIAFLPLTKLSGALKIAEALRKAVYARKLVKRSTNEKLGNITISVGIASLHPEDTASSLIGRADRCLYAAKRTGRNKVLDETSPDLDQGTDSIAFA